MLMKYFQPLILVMMTFSLFLFILFLYMSVYMLCSLSPIHLVYPWVIPKLEMKPVVIRTDDSKRHIMITNN